MDEYQLELAPNLGESFSHCPACGKELIAQAKECFACGAIPTRVQARQQIVSTKNKIGGIDHLSTEELKRLDRKWKTLVVNYHDQRGHEEFINLCHSTGAIPFATYHYSRMLEIDGDDDIALMMRRRAVSRLSVEFTPAGKGSVAPGTPLFLSLLKWASWVGIAGSAGFIVAGTAIPGSRNLIGLGVAMLTLFTALNLYIRR